MTIPDMIARARAMRRCGVETYRHEDGAELHLAPPKVRKKKYPRPAEEQETTASALPTDQRETSALAEYVFAGEVPQDIAAALSRAAQARRGSH